MPEVPSSLLKAEPPSPVIAGIGASTGGLEALERFLRQVPGRCGLAFVVVQHCYPAHKGIQPELFRY